MAYCPRLLAAFDRWRAIMSFVPGVEGVEGCGWVWVGMGEKTVQAVVVVDVRAVQCCCCGVAAAVLLCCYLAVLRACVLST